ncbi:MAG: DDE-type integrase/transposase/recombinase [Myxococcales bacterium]|nr:DDE-type integrase/transposase/recombinase [Myxococcales bacterium]
MSRNRPPQTPQPITHEEAVAQHRLGVIGTLVSRDFDHGELRAELVTLAQRRWRPPGADSTRTYSIPTLERWYYAFLADGIDGLRPRGRSDRGRGRALTAEQRKLLLEIRNDYPTVSSSTIIDVLVRRGYVEAGVLCPSTLNRFFAQHGAQRRARNASGVAGQRLRWNAAAPGAIWHGDVCHGLDVVGAHGKRTPVRVHALLDDASRYILALEVHEREREVDMLGMLARAIQRVGAPKKLYLDNGSTYRGEALATVCARLSVSLVHAAPYDPQARGKMERFWRTMREQCLDFVGENATLHDVNVRLLAWLDERYHQTPHAGLIGATPRQAWFETERVTSVIPHERLRDAFSVRDERRVRRDSTLDVDGVTYEVDVAILAGKTVQLVRYLPPFDVDYAPAIRHEERNFALHPVDPAKNASRHREAAPEPAPAALPDPRHNPANTVLDSATGRARHIEGDPV